MALWTWPVRPKRPSSPGSPEVKLSETVAQSRLNGKPPRHWLDNKVAGSKAAGWRSGAPLAHDPHSASSKKQAQLEEAKDRGAPSPHRFGREITDKREENILKIPFLSQSS